ncbi:peptidoglycan bridge formation glycyltransferase FemA/FemB family protein [Candidatus Saccharibacteria bacterium]|nr:peptidoglycan bridge formation glycyltransferase FemA/FemB family protein [Candidatus Saccharibacteria bacterium]MBI3338425.1 peptidoglycan bridge formation glycyltransferase FemA/FemB family protein [Candidatus Saccharibacteria bacterium]
MRHFLQSEAWQRFQQALGKEVISQRGHGWSFMGVIEQPRKRGGRLNRRLYLPYGPTCQDEIALGEALQAIRKIANQKKVVYVRLEPIILSGQTIDLKKYGCQPNKHPTQPDRTWVLNLAKDEENLLANMSGTNRNLWNTHKNKGLSFQIDYDKTDLKDFLAMLHAMAGRKGLKTHDDSYFKTMARSLFPEKDAGLAIALLHDKPIVAAIFFDDPVAGIRYYAHAGSFEEARKIQANSPLLTFLILDAKKRGFKEFDFYGVSPPGDELHRWAGHSKFKRSFGGVDKEYLGTWELPVRRDLFILAQVARKFSKLDLRKAPSSPDRLTSAANSFSSLDVPPGTSPSDKTVFARADSSWERGILRKSSKPLAKASGSKVVFKGIIKRGDTRGGKATD